MYVPQSNPLPFDILVIFTEKYPSCIAFIEKVTLSHNYLL